MTARRFWSHVRANLRFALRIVTLLVAMSTVMGAAVFFLFVWEPGWRSGLVAVALVLVAVRVLQASFAGAARQVPAWEWPEETAAREEREWQEARQGIELIAADPPKGTGTELESSGAPEGRGTELTAENAEPAQMQPPRERA